MIIRDELWKHPGFPGMIVITTNGVTRKDGALVMGRGAALEAKTRIPGLEYEAGEAIEIFRTADGYSLYHFMVIRQPTLERVGLGLFQVKYRWNEEAVVELISRSAVMLRNYALEFPDMKIRLNYPGIGNGRLSRDDVEPYMLMLPDNVSVCHR